MYPQHSVYDSGVRGWQLHLVVVSLSTGVSCADRTFCYKPSRCRACFANLKIIFSTQGVILGDGIFHAFETLSVLLSGTIDFENWCTLIIFSAGLCTLFVSPNIHDKLLKRVKRQMQYTVQVKKMTEVRLSSVLFPWSCLEENMTSTVLQPGPTPQGAYGGFCSETLDAVQDASCKDLTTCRQEWYFSVISVIHSASCVAVDRNN